jgi:uncharacterized repeat protein (TIGR03806 family)
MKSIILFLLTCYLIAGCSSEQSKIDVQSEVIVTPDDDASNNPDDEQNGVNDDDAEDITEDDSSEGEGQSESLIDLPTLASESDEECKQSVSGVNWEALAKSECKLLSQYQLFESASEPRQLANSPGIPYKLSVELFTDYAHKYRFVYIPEGKAMEFDPRDVFEFPVGSVLVKTFALPLDTSLTEPERLVETRLLIRRESGWKALPYRWVNDGEDAVLAKYGALLDIEMTNRQQLLNFKYEIPAVSTCNTCHQMQLDQQTQSFSPIGMKARLINWSLQYDDGLRNQIQKMTEEGILVGAPSDPNVIQFVPLFDEEPSDLQAKAKGYLDINCAHCHSDTGQGSLSGLRLEYWRETDSIKYGMCKVPPGFDGGEDNLHYDIYPGRSELSILPYRMSHLGAKDMMPPIGRGTVHYEGVALIKEWIDSLPFVDCEQQ